MSASETPGDQSNQIPLSLNQEFLCAFDKGAEEGAFSERHTLVFGWRVAGELDVDTLQLALDDVVARHEVLRTEIVRDGATRHQRVLPPSRATLTVLDLSHVAPADRDERAELLVNEVDASPFDVRELPHARLVLGRFDDTDSVLVLTTHHSSTDAWSLHVIIRDLAACYAVRRGLDADVPEVHQYREFAVAQLAGISDPAVTRALDYWDGKLRDAQILGIPTDRPRREGVPNRFALHRFLVDSELTTATLKFANASRSSTFMVLYAAYCVLLSKRTGSTDVVVPTFTSGRYDERYHNSVGPFFNFVPLRTDLAGCRTFRDVVDRARTTCIEAYSNDIPFPLVVGKAPNLVAPFADPGLTVVAFELLQSAGQLDGELVGDLKYSEIRRRLISQERAADIPDGALWAMDVLPSGEMVGSLKYNSNLFDENTMVDLASEFCRVLRSTVTAPEVPLEQI